MGRKNVINAISIHANMTSNHAPPPASDDPPPPTTAQDPSVSAPPPAIDDGAPPPSPLAAANSTTSPPPTSHSSPSPPTIPMAPSPASPSVTSPPAPPSPPPSLPGPPSPSSIISKAPPPASSTTPPPTTMLSPPVPTSSEKSPPHPPNLPDSPSILNPWRRNVPSPQDRSSSSAIRAHNGGGGKGGGIQITAIAGITGGCLLVGLLLFAVIFLCIRKKNKRKYGRDNESEHYRSERGGNWERSPYHPPVSHIPTPPLTSDASPYYDVEERHAMPDRYLSPYRPPEPYRPRDSPQLPGSTPPPPPHLHYSSSSSQDSWRPLTPPPASANRSPSVASNCNLAHSQLSFTYKELYEATKGFSKDNLLGEGGFGCVYKGRLPDDKLIAVKQLKDGSRQGEREFQAEVEIISRVHHRHLVSLVGYCIADGQTILVYDYVPNGTLEYHLHCRARYVMPWSIRLKIAVGSARGLAYLHEYCHPRIIHRDIKSSNILLDRNFEAQVSDFGLAKLTSDQHTHISTRVMGTFGYLAPEYASSGKLTEKSDVYSFGVVLLELIAGKKPVDGSRPLGDESLVDWARPYLAQAFETGNIPIDLVDERLESYDENEMLRMVKAAAACVHYSATRRPKMAQVSRVLESEAASADLNQEAKPGQNLNYGSSNEDTPLKFMNNKNLAKAKDLDYSGHSSEYGSGYSSEELRSSTEMDRGGRYNPSAKETDIRHYN